MRIKYVLLLLIAGMIFVFWQYITGAPGTGKGGTCGAAVPAECGAVRTGGGTMDTTDRDWKDRLTPEQYRVLREKGTERPYSGKYYRHSEEGQYRCAACGARLFDSDAKYDSGSGWPSFYEPADSGSISTKKDRSAGMTRTEVLCAKCGGHLGHVFGDGPEPTGKRYCINSVSLDFDPAKLEKATFAAGCFWGVEAAFRKIDGVVSTSAGYTGGTKENPSYGEVCGDATGHAEAVEILYDPEKVSYEGLLSVFWDIHNPTTPDRQGWDFGSQYRSAVFFHNDRQKQKVMASIRELEESGRFGKKIVTEVAPAGKFYRAEDYHQQYYEKRGGSCGG